MQFVGPGDDDVDPVGVRPARGRRRAPSSGRRRWSQAPRRGASRPRGTDRRDRGRTPRRWTCARPGTTPTVAAASSTARVPATLAWKKTSGASSLRVTCDSAAKWTMSDGRSARTSSSSSGDATSSRTVSTSAAGTPSMPALVAGIGVEIGVEHRLAVRRQGAHERRADEAEAARDEHPPAHGSSIPAPASGSSDARAWARKRRTSSASYPGSTTARPARAANMAAVRPCTNRSAAAPWCFRA